MKDSMNVICFLKGKNHCASTVIIKRYKPSSPRIIETRVGPQTSKWTNENRIAENILLIRSKTRWCIETSQISQWEILTSKLLNNEGNKVWRKVGVPNKWWSQVSSMVDLSCDAQARVRWFLLHHYPIWDNIAPFV